MMPDALSATVNDMLRHAGAQDAAERGLVHVVSVAAIREAVGARWSRHEPLVEDFVLRAFKRGARDDDLIVRVNSTDFILIQPTRPPMAALSRAAQLMRESLSYFLGAVKTENIHISVVDSLGGPDGLSLQARRVSASDMESAANARVDLTESEDGSPPWEKFGIARPPRSVVSIRRPEGGDLQAMFYLDPIWHVARGAVVSFVARTVTSQKGPDGEPEVVDPQDLTASTFAALAVRRIRFIKSLVEEDPETPLAVALHLPISLNCLSFSSTRILLLAELKKLAGAGLKNRLFVEISDVPPALPQVRLAEVIAQLRPFVRGVLVRTSTVDMNVLPWGGCGAVGVVPVIQPQDLLNGEKDIVARLPRFVDSATRIGMFSGLYGVRSRSMALAAWAAGMTHLSGDYIAGRFGEALLPQRFHMRDLYDVPETAAPDEAVRI